MDESIGGSNRKVFQQKMNDLLEKYNRKKVELKQARASEDDFRKLDFLFNKRKQELEQLHSDSLMKLNKGEVIPVKGGTITKSSDLLDQSNLPDAADTKLQGKTAIFKKLGKKLKSTSAIVPGSIGAGLGLLGASLAGEASTPDVAAAIDPTGVADLALEAKRRSELTDPKEIESIKKDDFRQALPLGLQDQSEFLYDEQASNIKQEKMPMDGKSLLRQARLEQLQKNQQNGDKSAVTAARIKALSNLKDQ